jgi:hypothetical protein
MASESAADVDADTEESANGSTSLASSEPTIVVASLAEAESGNATSAAAETDSEREILESYMNEILGSSLIQRFSVASEAKVLDSSGADAGNLVISNGSGLTAYLSYDLGTEQGIQYSWFSFDVDGVSFVAVPQSQGAQLQRNQDGSVTLFFISTDLLIGDTTGSFDFIASDESAVSRGALRIQVDIDQSGKVTKSTMSLAPRT